jgi:hypothetical protein
MFHQSVGPKDIWHDKQSPIMDKHNKIKQMSQNIPHACTFIIIISFTYEAFRFESLIYNSAICTFYKTKETTWETLGTDMKRGP